jgi:hypothetical protein
MVRDSSTYRGTRRNNWREAWIPASPVRGRSRFKPWVQGFIGASGTALVIGFAIGSFGPAGLLNMMTSYVMLAAAWLIGTITIAISEWLWGFPATHRIVVGASASLLLGVALVGIGSYEAEKNYELTHLVAGNDPTPPHQCGKADEKSFLYFWAHMLSASLKGYSHGM